MPRGWKIALGLTISAVALALAFRAVDLGAFGRAVASARLVWLLPALACFVLMFAARAARWATLLGGTPFWTTLLALIVGYMMNNTLPLRLGEVGRAYVISERTRMPMMRALSSVVVERVLDLASVVLAFSALAQLVPMPPALARAASFAAVVIAAAVLSGAFLVWKAEAVERLLRGGRAGGAGRGEAWWSRFRELVASFRAIGSPARLALVVAQTAIVWVMTVLLAYFAMGAFLTPNGVEAGVVVVAANLGGALPSAPGGLGVIQGFAKMALVIPFHVPEDRALAFVFVWSLGQQAILILLGAAALGRLGMSFGQARRLTVEAESAGAESGDGEEAPPGFL